MKIRLGKFRARLGKTVHAPEISVADPVELKIAGPVALRIHQMRHFVFRKADQIAERKAEHPGETIERIHLRFGLVPFQLGDHAGRNAAFFRQLHNTQVVTFPQFTQDPEIADLFIFANHFPVSFT